MGQNIFEVAIESMYPNIYICICLTFHEKFLVFICPRKYLEYLRLQKGSEPIDCDTRIIKR